LSFGDGYETNIAGIRIQRNFHVLSGCYTILKNPNSLRYIQLVPTPNAHSHYRSDSDKQPHGELI